MNTTRFVSCVSLAALVFCTSCLPCVLFFKSHPVSETFARHSNPIAGWTFRPFDEYSPPRDQRHYQLSKAITDDYQQFIADKKFPYPPNTITGFFEDGTGQRAVQFEIGLNGTRWVYVVIYDENDNRIRVVKYVGGHYMS